MDRDSARMWDRIIREDEEQGLPFIDIPSAPDIAHYFIDCCLANFDGQGCEGISLWRDGRDYSYAWMEAHVDHDLEQYFLIDVRTNIGDTESRDYLYVCVGIGCKVEFEWHNQPVPFGATYETHMHRFVSGMKWFTNQIVAKRDELAAEANEPTAQE